MNIAGASRFHAIVLRVFHDANDLHVSRVAAICADELADCVTAEMKFPRERLIDDDDLR
jgi:hypothetical protein